MDGEENGKVIRVKGCGGGPREGRREVSRDDGEVRGGGRKVSREASGSVSVKGDEGGRVNG